MGSLEDKLEHFAAAITLESQRTREAFQAGLSEFVRGQRVTGAIRRPVRNGQVYNVGGRLVGWSMRAAGGAVTVDLYDGTNADGDLLASVSLTDGQSSAVPIMPAGVNFAEGVYAVVTTTTGTLTGAVWIGAVD